MSKSRERRVSRQRFRSWLTSPARGSCSQPGSRDTAEMLDSARQLKLYFAFPGFAGGFAAAAIPATVAESGIAATDESLHAPALR